MPDNEMTGLEEREMPRLRADQEITHDAVITFDQDTIIDNQNYSSKGDNEHAVLIKGGHVDINSSTISKVGDADGDTADFYGTNAAIISTDGVLKLHDMTINTAGKHANAVFSYGSGDIFIADSTITTKKDNSGGIMVTGGGTLSAENVNITTEGNSSAAIRSDRGGGTIEVDRGNYTTNGAGSPVIYSTASILVQHSQLTATQSEGAIVEGKNSITIINSTLTDSNTILHGQSSTYKNIFLYQSMSGDADRGTAGFTAIDSKIITNNGDTIYVTNTKAEILLQNNEIINNNGDFLRIEGAAWGKQGSNGGNVTLNLVKQNVSGDIIVDNISSLSMELSNQSSYVGAINVDNESQSISVTLDISSTWTLTNDSYISEIKSSGNGLFSSVNLSYSIDLNGYTLYVGDEAITSIDQLATDKLPLIDKTEEILTTESNESEQSDNILVESHHSNSGLIIIGIIIIAIIAVTLICLPKLKKNREDLNQ